MRKLALLISCMLVVVLYAQYDEALLKGERIAYEAKHDFKSKRSGQEYDLVYHSIHLNIDPGVRMISGSVYSELIALEDNFSQFSFDLDVGMIVDSFYLNGGLHDFTHSNDEISISISPILKGEKINVEVFYHGDPSKHEQKGFGYSAQGAGPIAWTLSQPYGAYGWWPCKQQLYDKIDSIDLHITVPSGNKVGSLGLLTHVDTLADSQLVFHWKHRYPVATYLVAVAVSNYYEESHYIQLSDGDSIYHLDYLYPAYKPAADTLRWQIDGMMRGFDSLFGPYPFRKEKYGHVMFARGGGMEHQTMSFMGTLNFDLMAHELGHMWFGDKITCASWQDLWLNEGWATYSNVLAHELVKGRDSYLEFVRFQKSRVLDEDGGSVYAYDTADRADLFSGRLRYGKGAMVLQQLRWTVGDSAFFEGTRNYMANAEYCYGFAHTIDFQEAVEEASGMDLDDFVDRYIYQEGYPILTSTWRRINPVQIGINVLQNTSHSSVSFYPMKIQYLAIGDERDSLITIDHAQSGGEVLVDVGFAVRDLVFDPNEWILGRSIVLEGDHSDISSIAIYPNPAKSSISVYMQDKKMDRIEMVDAQGRVMQEKQVFELKGVPTQLDLRGIANGVYFVKIYGGDESWVTRLVVANEN